MRSYCGLYVDAGYLLAAASTRVSGTSLRAATRVDFDGLIAGLIRQATMDADLPLLRVHWYDSGNNSGAADTHQRAIAAMSQVKLRLGRRGLSGEQKGVDLKLGLDLVTQARNRVIDVVYLISGDDDLTEAVEEAQHLGVQVVLLAVADQNGVPISVSRNLEMASDGLQLIDRGLLDTSVQVVVAPDPSANATEPATDAPPPPSPKITPATVAAMKTDRSTPAPTRIHAIGRHLVYTSSADQRFGVVAGWPDEHTERAIDAVVDQLVRRWRASAGAAEISELHHSKPTIPPDLDRSLLQDLSARLDVYELTRSASLCGPRSGNGSTSLDKPAIAAHSVSRIK